MPLAFFSYKCRFESRARNDHLIIFWTLTDRSFGWTWVKIRINKTPVILMCSLEENRSPKLTWKPFLSSFSDTWNLWKKVWKSFLFTGFHVQLWQSGECKPVWIFSVLAPETGPVHHPDRFTHPVAPGGRVSGVGGAAGGQRVHQRALFRKEEKLHKIHSPWFSRSESI